MDRYEDRNKKLIAVDVWIQCTKKGLESILDDNDGDINHVNSLDQEPIVWLEPTETKRSQQWELKKIPRDKLETFFVCRG